MNQRRRQVRSNFELVAGPLPGPEYRVPLDVQVIETVDVDGLTRIKLTYQSDPLDRVPAFLILPKDAKPGKTPAVLCLHQTFSGGKAEPTGLAGDPRLSAYMSSVREGLVFFLRPHPALVVADGVRAGVAWEEVVRIDGMVKLLLEMFGVRYIPIDALAMQERVRLVERVLELSGLEPAAEPGDEGLVAEPRFRVMQGNGPAATGARN